MNKDFFNRNAEVVARELLGKVIVRKISENGINKELKARIVETEAYFDEKDPASRACKNGDLRDTMKMEAGTILVYGVHNNWLVNIVTDDEGIASAVLIRAIEPLNFEGKCSGPGLLTKSLRIDKNFHKRNIINNKEIWIEDFGSQENIGNNQYLDRNDNQSSKPELSKDSKFGVTSKNNLESKKSRASEISSTESMKLPITKINNKLDNIDNNFEIIESFRIGIKKDLSRKLRFYIKDNKWVSRK